jgi:hypothetical protein
MAELSAQWVRGGSVVLDIGEDTGALVIYTGDGLRGQQIDLSPKANLSLRIHTDVHARDLNGRQISAAVFALLPEGEYRIWKDGPGAGEVTIAGGSVAQIDWRGLADIRLLSQTYDESHLRLRACIPPELLPPRYRKGRPVSAAPMGSAPMRFGEDGQVAWDQMWTSFCDLAMAGGPPHRGTLLRPVPLEAVLADPEGYARVVAEIERGLRLVTGMPTLPSEEPGWVALRCADEDMARWLAWAIELENISVRRQGTMLLLPAGPSFRLDQEVKNVVTAVAKTHHYWMEHLLAT